MLAPFLAALAVPRTPDVGALVHEHGAAAAQLSRRDIVKCGGLPDTEVEPCMLSLLQVAEHPGIKAPSDEKTPDGKSTAQGTLVPPANARKPQHAARGHVPHPAAHGPKWEARYEEEKEKEIEEIAIQSSKEAATKQLSKAQVDPPPDDSGYNPEEAAAQRAAMSGADDAGKKVDDTEYQESTASENPDRPEPAPHICTGPGAVAGDPLCSGSGTSADPANLPAGQAPAGEVLPGTNPADERCRDQTFRQATPEVCGGTTVNPGLDSTAAAAADPAADDEPAECKAVMDGVSDEWCATNCAIDNCPATMCNCKKEDEEVDPNKPVCVSIAPNVSDDWCQTNCERWIQHEEGFFNCPPSQCKCEEHPSEGGEGNDVVQGMGFIKAKVEAPQ